MFIYFTSHKHIFLPEKIYSILKIRQKEKVFAIAHNHLKDRYVGVTDFALTHITRGCSLSIGKASMPDRCVINGVWGSAVPTCACSRKR